VLLPRAAALQHLLVRRGVRGSGAT
jgi:hypothetical protein